MLECSLHYDVEALMVLYGFIVGRGALGAAREDYFKASCWLQNAKCLIPPHSESHGSSGFEIRCLSLKDVKSVGIVWFERRVSLSRECDHDKDTEMSGTGWQTCNCSPNLQL